jgi:cation/acetate symporter
LGSDYIGTDVSLLAKLDQVVTDLGFSQYTTTAAGSTLNMFMYTVSLMIGTAGLPHVIVRFFTVPKVADARSSAGWALVFIALLYTTAPAVGAMAKFNLHATVNSAVASGGDLFAPEASLQYEARPDWMKRWEKTGLLKFEDKNGDGRIQFYNAATKNEAVKAKADAAGWKGNELTVNADIIVLANPEIALLPNWVIALVAAGGLAAALSTAAGLLLAISSAVSHDLIKGAIKPDISEKGELMAGKIAMAGAIFLAGYLGLNPPGFAAGTVALAFGIAASTIFPALMMGIFSKTVSDKGASAGMLAGLIVTLFYVFAHKGIFFVKGTEYLDLIGGANSFFTITPEAFGTVGAIVNFVVAYLVSKMGAPVPQHIQALVESVRVPKGAGAASAGH